MGTYRYGSSEPWSLAYLLATCHRQHRVLFEQLEDCSLWECGERERQEDYQDTPLNPLTCVCSTDYDSRLSSPGFRVFVIDRVHQNSLESILFEIVSCHRLELNVSSH